MKSEFHLDYCRNMKRSGVMASKSEEKRGERRGKGREGGTEAVSEEMGGRGWRE